MSTDNSITKLSYIEFLKIKDELSRKITGELEIEIEMSDFETDNEDEEDLWTTPLVDSKSVIKLSPIVEEMTGQKIKPEWIKPGGYDSLEDAISHLVQQLELDLRKAED